jgi:hypothetical protein
MFPKEIALKELWLKAIKKAYPLIEINEIKKYSKICSRHFNRNDIVGGQKKQLRLGAIPCNSNLGSSACGKEILIYYFKQYLLFLCYIFTVSVTESGYVFKLGDFPENVSSMPPQKPPDKAPSTIILSDTLNNFETVRSSQNKASENFQNVDSDMDFENMGNEFYALDDFGEPPAKQIKKHQFGQYKIDDMNDSEIAKQFFQCANETATKQKKQIKNLQQKLRNIESRHKKPQLDESVIHLEVGVMCQKLDVFLTKAVYTFPKDY